MKKTKYLSNQRKGYPPPPPPSEDSKHFHKDMDSIRAFELQQITYSFQFCTICHERRLDMKMTTSETCERCYRDKQGIKRYSKENNMDPGKVPEELKDLTII